MSPRVIAICDGLLVNLFGWLFFIEVWRLVWAALPS